MKPENHQSALAVLFCLLTLMSSVPAKGQELSSAEVSAIKTGAQQHVEYYYDLYYQRNPEALSTEVFTLPWYTMGANGLSALSSEEENMEYFSSAIAGLLERGWNRSIFSTKNVCVLNAGAAIVSGTNTRTRTDGSVMSVGGVSYMLGKTGDEWRIISFAGHSADKVVRCENE